MKNPFILDKSFKVRHKILEFLYQDWETHDRAEARIVGSVKISEQTKISITDINRWQILLVEKNEITVSNNDGQYMMSIQPLGRSAYIDQKYLKEGRRERTEGIWNWARILIPLGTLVLSLFNYFSNRSLGERIKKVETYIQQKK